MASKGKSSSTLNTTMNMPVHLHALHALPLSPTPAHMHTHTHTTHLDISYYGTSKSAKSSAIFVVDRQSGQPEDERGRVHVLHATTRDRDGGPLDRRRGWGYLEF